MESSLGGYTPLHAYHSQKLDVTQKQLAIGYKLSNDTDIHAPCRGLSMPVFVCIFMAAIDWKRPLIDHSRCYSTDI